MSAFPLVPSDFKPRSFWQRPEGGAGKGLVALLAIAAGVGLFMFWGVIVPFILTTVMDTFWVCVYGAAVAVFCDVLLGLEPVGKTMHNLIKNIFQSVARGLARCYTTIDPIGILRNNLDDMRKEKDTLDQTVQRFSGSEEKLQRSISAKKAEVTMLGRKVDQAKQMASQTTEALKRNSLTLESQTYLEKAGMLMQGIKQLEALEQQTAKLLNTFQNWSQVADAKIERTKNRVDFLAEQRGMILDAKSTLSVGQKLLRGKPEQLAMVDMALEYLEEDTSRTLGEIREFSRYTDKLFTEDQIESGANAAEASAQFEEFSQKLLSASTASTVDGLASHAPVATPVYVARQTTATDDYDPFK
jgi:hypothetical protein